MSVEGFFGLKEQNLMDLIQMWGLAKATGILKIASGKEEGEIHFDDGKLVWAKAGPHLSDDDAIFHILALQEGKFRFINTSLIQRSDSLNASYHEVVMEGMIRLDNLKNERIALDDKFGFIPYIVNDNDGLDRLAYDEKVFLGLVDGRRNLENVFNNSGLGVHKNFETYRRLDSQGIIKLRKIRVLVVDDQAMWRKVLSGILNRDPYIEVVGTAENGIDALRKLSELRPDVMTLDLEMPDLDGLQTLYWMMSGGYDILLRSHLDKEIEDTYRCPVVVISAVATKMATETLEALMAGASAYITKPSQVSYNSIEEQQHRIIKTVLMASQIDLMKSRRIRPHKVDKGRQVARPNPRKLVCVGASMVGGLTSLMQMIPALPEDMDASVFVVIDDMDSIDHARSFADFLDQHSRVNVLTADRNTILRKGCVYISSGQQTVRFGITNTGQNAFKVFQKGDEGLGNELKPIDEMLHSAIKCRGFDKRVGIVLAGDGDDGKIGFLEMVKHGEPVFVQDFYSSLNPVKPEIIAGTGIARIIPLENIVRSIIDETGKVAA